MVMSRRNRTSLRPLRVAAALAVFAACVQPAAGINIEFLWDSTSDPSPGDPGGIGLFTVTAPAVEELWESIILDPVTVTIRLGYHDLDSGNLMEATADVISGGGQPIHGYVHADIDPEFRFEMSPLTSTHFNLSQTIVRDLTPEQQYLWYNTSPPNSLPQAVLEVSYGGWADVPDPATEDYDAFSFLAHEVGHVLGLSWTMAEDETFGQGDWDYDLPFLASANAAVNTVGTDPDDVNSYGHLATPSLMAPGISNGYRMFPSATDILAIAQAGNWSYLALPRMDYLGGPIFSDGFNWPGGRTPTPFTDTFVRQNNGPPPLAVAQTTMFFRNLNILEGSWVTSDHPLNVEETTVIDGTDAGVGNSRVRIQSNGSLETTDLYVGWAGVVSLIGGFLDVDNRADVDLAGRIQGYGTVFVKDWMVNNGRITADGGQLILSTTSPDSVHVWDLGGGGGGTVEAVDGDIFIHGSHYGWFHGTMVIGQGRYVSMDREWVLAEDGLVQFNGAQGSPARLSGTGLKVINGELEVNGQAVIASPVHFNGPAGDGAAHVRIIEPSASLTLTGPATFEGGLYYGGGTLIQAGDFTVQSTTMIVTHTFDWGNSDMGQRNDIVVEGGAVLGVRSALTGTPDNEYRGRINLLSSTLDVDTDDPWTLPAASPDAHLPEGVLIFGEHKKGSPPTVEGQQLTVGGSVRAYDGLGVIDAPFVTRPTATISVFAEAELELRQSTRWNGGTISGDGGIRQIGDARVVGSTQIATSYYDFDGDDDSPSQTTIDPNMILQINSTSIENDGADSFDGVVNVNGGGLTINTTSSWTLGKSGAMNLTNSGDSAAVAGSPMVVFGHVTTTGNNKILSPVRFRDSAKVVATAPDDILHLRGHTDYDGGSYTGAGGIIQDADAFVNEPTTIDLGFFDMDGPTDANGEEDTFVELHADLTLNVDRVDISDNRFDGELEVTDPATLTVNTPTPWTMAGSMEIVGPGGTQVTVAGAEIVLQADVWIEPQNLLRFEADVSGPGNFTGGGDYEMLGDYNPGSSPAVVTSAGGVSFSDSARLLLDIGGTDVVPVTQYDRLEVAGDVALDGTVVFRFTDGFAPQVADTFDVIVAGGAASSMLGDGDIVIENLAPGFLYDVGFEVASGLSIFRLTALSDAALPSSVSGRYVFYNNSAFDLPGDGRTDDDAVAPDKRALLPGETAAFENYTSYAKGINGVMIDIDGLTGTPTIEDFEFRVGNDDNPDGWADAPDPTDITVRLDEGDDGTDRITILWEDKAIRKEWLQVIVLATGETGLLADDVFYFGNAIGESGNALIDAKVNAIDMLAARNNPHHFFDPALIDDLADFNRDAKVNATDMLIARNHTTSFFNALQLITVPGAKAAVIPEPSTLALLVIGAGAWLACAWRKRRRKQMTVLPVTLAGPSTAQAGLDSIAPHRVGRSSGRTRWPADTS